MKESKDQQLLGILALARTMTPDNHWGLEVQFDFIIQIILVELLLVLKTIARGHCADLGRRLFIADCTKNRPWIIRLAIILCC